MTHTAGMTRRTGLLIAAATIAVIGGILLPNAQTTFAGVPQIVTIYGVALLFTEGTTGVLLLDLAVLTRSRSALLLGCAYLYSAIMAVLHVLTFPGALIPNQPVLGGPNAIAWQFAAWKLGFAMLAITGVWLRPQRAQAPLLQPRRTAALSAAATLIAGALIGLIICSDILSLGPAVAGGRYMSPALIFSWAAVVAHAVGAVLAARIARQGDWLCLWLSFALGGFALELVFAIAGGGRYTLGWYSGRISGVVAACALFLMFLTRYVAQSRGMAAALASAELRASELQEEIRRREQAEQRLLHAQKMEALGQLAGGVAHDLNNVLQAVQGGASLIERRSQPDDAMLRLLRMILQAAERGSAITRRLLAFSRHGDIHAEPVDPASLLTNMRDIMVHTLGAGIGIRVRTTPNLPPMRVDKGQLETVLINLGVNARDAMEGNGLLTLSAELETVGREVIHAAELEAGSYIRLAIADTGSGMSREVLARATEPFFTTKPPGQGTGLGLAMARGFCEQSGGGLLVDSVLGRGTTVTLWIPIAQGAEPAMARPLAVDCSSAPVHVLLVDDDAIVREIIAEELRAEGYATLTAADGSIALSMLRSADMVNILVCDLSMPGMDGLAVIREAQQRRPDLPAVLLTGFATPAAEIALGGSVSGLLSLKRKPVTGPQLAEHLQAVLSGAGMVKRQQVRRPA